MPDPTLEAITARMAWLRREMGRTRAGVHGAATVVEAARAFGLNESPGTYRELAPAAAEEVLAMVIHQDLAYDLPICDLQEASQLAKEFVEAAVSAGMTFHSNGDLASSQNPRSWNPATQATFDSGILAVGPTGCACFWVEDED